MYPKPTLLAAVLLTALPAAALPRHAHASNGAKQAPAVAQGPRTVELAVLGEGFVPARITARKGERLRLVVTRRTDRTCATEIVIKDAGVNQKLPLNQPVVIELRPRKSGTMRYACGMDMVAGAIVVD